MTPESPTAKSSPLNRRTVLVLAAGLVAACGDDGLAPSGSRRAPDAEPRVLGFVELIFEGVGTPDISASLISAPTMAELEALHAERERLRQLGDDVVLDLTPIGPGNGTIQFGSGTGALVSAGGNEYLHGTFPVRNAQIDGTGYDTERVNLTLLAVSTENTINGTAIRTLRLADGSPADPAIALDVTPTGLVELDSDSVVSVHPDVLQILTETEVSELTPPAGVTGFFPYAFVVRNATSDDTRTLPASPAAGDFAGVVDFAFSIPQQTEPTDDPRSLSFTLVAMDDSETRLTQSLQEQTPTAELALQQRAVQLGADSITLLPGGTLPGWSDPRTICSVRTGGTAASPTAHLVNVDWTFDTFSPDPYATNGSASHIDSTTAFQATFNADAHGAEPETFTVRGLQSGPAFQSAAYSGNGTTTISTPSGTFFPGEEIEIALTSALVCPEQRPVARYRVQVAGGSGTFGPQSPYATDDTPTYVAVGDLTGNGVPDVVTSNPTAFDEHTISVLLNDGNGTFQAHQSFDVARSPESVALGDVNGDGNLDAVTANAGANNVSVLLGDGSGGFQAQQTFGAGETPIGLAIGDLTGNGVLDVVTANQGASNISVLLGNGDGTFQPQETFAAGPNPSSVALGDLTGDGVLDVVTGDFDPLTPSVSVLLGSGDGTFLLSQTMSVFSQPSHVVLGDINNNGTLDLVVTNFTTGDNSVSVFLGGGNGTFQAGETFATGDRPASVALGDLTGNDVLDLAVANAASGDVSVLLGNGNGTFQDQQTFGVGVAPLSVALSDLTGNGVLDIVTANEGSNDISVLLAQP